MASKSKKQARRSPSSAGTGPHLEVERLIEKGRLKDAVKQGKLCYRQESTPAHHQLLERAYFLRAEQLRRDGLPTAAEEVARHLLDFGVTDPALVEDTARLLLALGMSRQALELQGRLDSPEARERLARQAADQAVLHPDRVAASPPEVQQGVLRVRAALQALEAGDEARALSELRDVARNSPFGDWKLFARGLAAFSRREAEEMRANWDRLDPRRAASRIARALLALAGPAPAGPDGRDAGANLESLEKRVFGASLLGPLGQIRELVAQDRWDEAIRLLGPLRFSLRRVDPALAERVTRVLSSSLIRSARRLGYRQAEALVGAFNRVAEPPAIDPHWNRLWALIWEGPQGDLDGAESYWRAYLDDLKTLSIFPPEEGRMAQALVWCHLGERLVGDAESLARDPFGPPPSDREVKAARRRAIDCLEESLRIDPTRQETYRVLLDACEDWDQPELAAATARRLLEVAPKDFEALMFLSGHHFRLDEPGPALEYARRARVLKPLDAEAAQQEWAARVSLARHLALRKRPDEGRAELSAAEAAWPEQSRKFHFLARRAVFELKAGQADRAEGWIVEAQGRLVEPTPLWLALLVEAIRYKLPKADRDRFEARWVDALKKKCRGETAGALAELLAAFLGSDTKYPGRAGHLKQVVDYLRRTTRIKYRREDLALVCGLLGLVPKERALFATMAKRGLKLFPDAPVFLVMVGAMELEKGPFRGDLRLARKQFEKALGLARASSDPTDVALLPQIEQSLSLLTDLTSGPMGMPFPGFGGGPLPSRRGPSAGLPNLFRMFDAMLDEAGIDPDDEPPPPRPYPRRAGPGRKRKGAEPS